jgi:hypothetical protein
MIHAFETNYAALVLLAEQINRKKQKERDEPSGSCDPSEYSAKSG